MNNICLYYYYIYTLYLVYSKFTLYILILHPPPSSPTLYSDSLAELVMGKSTRYIRLAGAVLLLYLTLEFDNSTDAHLLLSISFSIFACLSLHSYLSIFFIIIPCKEEVFIYRNLSVKWLF